jgi:hypothetical protein
MDYKGEWGEGALDTPGPLNVTSEAHTVVLYCDGDFNWLGQVWGGGDMTPPWRSGE